MSKKVAFVVNEKDRLTPFIIEIEERDGSEYIMEKELVFLTDVDYESEGARGFAQGMSVGHFLKTLEDVAAEKDKLEEEGARDIGALDSQGGMGTAEVEAILGEEALASIRRGDG